jgi:diguanylate cyclase (GGDEF)-like protein/PAS domain S-box-containing protein
MNDPAALARRILDSIGDAVLSTDRDWRITFMNPVAEKMLGWPSADAIGRHASEVFVVIDGGSRERVMPLMEEAAQSGQILVLPPNCILIRRDGTETHIEDSAAAIHGSDGEIAGMVVVFHDVGESRAMAQKMSHLAKHDVLTGLPNRALLEDRLEQGIALAARHSRQLAVLFIDLDDFKHINDSLGHRVGDQLLKAVADRITPCVRHSDTVSRQGGDEFIVLLAEISHQEDASLIADKIRAAILEPYLLDTHYLQLTASIGISVYPGDAEHAEVLLQHADTAMYHAKDKGRNQSQFFKEDMNVRAAEQRIITGDLRLALARNEFELRYQPKISLQTGTITGFEALIRWRHPGRGLLLPDRFIPIAEDNGLIIPIGKWVLQEACSQAQGWLAAGLNIHSIAVNVSAVEFRRDDFFDNVCAVLQTTGLAPHHLELELTETAVMRDIEATHTVLLALSRMGIRIAVDDFGTGYSNLSYLKRFPVNTLKLDRSFVNDIPQSADASTIVSSVIQMARSLHLSVVAEGVETLEQLNCLNANHCEEGQGYFFSGVMEAGEVEALILDNPFAMSCLQRQVGAMLAEASPRDPSMGQEMQRNHASRELHDDIQQILFGLSLNMLPSSRAPALPPPAEQVATWRALIGEALNDLRVLTLRLRAPVVAAGGATAGGAAPANGAAASSMVAGHAAARQALIAKATENSSVAVIVTDASGVIVWGNPAFTTLCEYTLEEVIGRNPGRLLQGADTDRQEAARLGRAIRNKKAATAHLTNYAKTARKYWIDIAIEPLLDPSGGVDAFIAYITDTTDRHRRLSATEAA